jgi:F-type H+-transporting ATP synthase subunit e
LPPISHPHTRTQLTPIQVLRWSALGVGVFYGAYHQLGISAKNKMSQEKREWERKESLIAQAKAEWARQHPAQQPKRASGGTYCKAIINGEKGELEMGKGMNMEMGLTEKQRKQIPTIRMLI